VGLYANGADSWTSYPAELSGNLSVTSGGTIGHGSNSWLNVTGSGSTSTFTSVGDITLNRPENNFGSVIVNSGRDVALKSVYNAAGVTIGLPQAAGGLRNVTLDYASAPSVTLSANGASSTESRIAELSGNLAVTSGGAILHGAYSWLGLTGAAPTSAFTSAGSITLNQNSNYLGAVTVSPTLATVSANLFNNSKNASLTLSTPVTNLTLTQPNANLTLPASKVTGSVHINTQGGAPNNTISVGQLTLSGSLDLRAESGITPTGAWSVGTSANFDNTSGLSLGNQQISAADATTLAAGAGIGDIVLDNVLNNLKNVTVNSGRDVTLKSVYNGGVNLGLPQAAGGLRNISIEYPSATSLAIGNGSGNDAAMSGNLSVTSGGSISHWNGYLSLNGASSTSVFAAGGNITLDNGANNLGAVTVTGATISSVAVVNNSTNAGLTLAGTSDLNINGSVTNTGGNVILRADKNGTGTGTLIFGASGSVTVNGGGRADLYYNPTSYAAPTDYSAKFLSGTPNTSWMLVNDVGQATGGTRGLQAMNTNLAGNYALGKDIHAAATSTWNSTAGFAPVGDATTAFTGKFDGLNHTISDLKINRSTQDYAGLFGKANGATIKNVGLMNVTVTGQNYAGGLVGDNYGTITNSYSTGTVNGSGSYVGGLAGRNHNTIDKSYSTVAVSDSDGSYVGGLVGDNDSGTISYSYSAGWVSGANYVGGLVGNSSGGTITNSYWDKTTSGQTTSAWGTGLTTAQMISAANFSGWDFTNTWTINEGSSYPYLRWAGSVPVGGGANNYWIGSAQDYLWFTAGNWSAGHVPTGTESVRIDVAGTPTITASGSSISFGSLWLNENLNVGSTFNVSSLFTLNSGTATFDGTAIVGSLNLVNGTLKGSGQFTVNSSYIQSGSGSIDRSGAMSINQAAGNLAFAAAKVGALTLTAPAGNITVGNITSTGAVGLSALSGIYASSASSVWSVGGNLTLNNASSGFSLVNPISVGGATTLTALAGIGDITLDNVVNSLNNVTVISGRDVIVKSAYNFGGVTVDLPQSAGRLGNVTISYPSATSLAIGNSASGAATMSGNLLLTSGGTISQWNGYLNLNGALPTSIFTAGGNITLNSSSNYLGAVSVNPAKDTLSVDFYNNSSNATLTLVPTAGNSAGAITNLSLIQPNASLTLAANQVKGNLYVNNQGGTSTNNTLTIGAQTLNGSMDLRAENGIMATGDWDVHTTANFNNSSGLALSNKISVGGATTLTALAGIGDISLDNITNNLSNVTINSGRDVTLKSVYNFGGVTVDLPQSAGRLGNVTITYPSATSLAIGNSASSAATLGGNLSVTSGGTITQWNGYLNLNNPAATSVFSAGGNITLNSSSNYLGAVSVNPAKDTLSIDFYNNSSNATLTLVPTAGNSAGAVKNLTLTQPNASFELPANKVTGSLYLNTQGGSSTTDALTVGAQTLTGTLQLYAEGNITQTGAISAAGATTLGTTAGTGNIILGNAANSLRDVTVNSGYDVTLTSAYTSGATIGLPQSAGRLGNVTISYPSATSLAIGNSASGAATMSGNLLLTSGGTISQWNGYLNLNGALPTSIFTAGGNITLNSSSNYLGAVSVNPAKDTLSVDFYNNSSNATLTLVPTAGNSAGAITNLSLIQPNASLTLAANQVKGNLYVNNQGGTSTNNTLTIGAQTLNGSMDLRAENGIMATGDWDVHTTANFNNSSGLALSNKISVGGATTLTALAGIGDISLDNITNNLSNVTINSGRDVTLKSVYNFGGVTVDLPRAVGRLRDVTIVYPGANVAIGNGSGNDAAIEGNLSLSAGGTISQWSGYLSLNGASSTSSFTAGGNITLNSTSNKLGAITVLGPDISSVTVSNTSANAGLTLSSTGDLNINGSVTNTGGNVVLRADKNGTGTGTVIFGASGSVTVNGGGRADVYYNPTSYATPTDYSAKFLSNTPNAAWMLVNDVGQVSGGTNGLQAMDTNLSGNYALGRDIDATATSSWCLELCTGFAPIGYSSANPFTGSFDGLGHTIDSLTINGSYANYIGLFGYTTNNATLRNVGLTNLQITGFNEVGGLVGHNNGSITNSYTTGMVIGNMYIGGLAGVNGDIQGSTSTITNSYSTASVTGNGSDGGTLVGGLVGYNTNATITDSYSTGAVYGVGNMVGGLVGKNDVAGSIISSYSTGAVAGNGTDVGGLLGYNNGDTVTNSYWDKDTSGQTTSAGGTGLSTLQMMSSGNFSGWDFIGTWNINEGGSYPYHRLGGVPTVFNNYWIGSAGTYSWFDVGNWSASHVPTGNENVRIDVAGPLATISAVGSSISFGSLWLNENLTVGSNVPSFSVSRLLTINGGTATFDGTATVGSLNLVNGTLKGSGAFTVNSSFAQSGSSGIDRTGSMNITQAVGNIVLPATKASVLTLSDPLGSITGIDPISVIGTTYLTAGTGNIILSNTGNSLRDVKVNSGYDVTLKSAYTGGVTVTLPRTAAGLHDVTINYPGATSVG
ncbi:MAG: GLUG motif-containing protein, partial [Candidatus Cryosericum sp.]